ncbi:putative entry exclusion protein TrbK-alt [Novosphingobium resinovorum]|uniref:putative entry exclusion protein TrbK-alt n=1 Tax=Novosphingobium resinovorum TaxID=158500 RepID=UPI000563BCA5|nr:putative entry exclusion protein TrbK-alt [Novosphingobium resinovorum]
MTSAAKIAGVACLTGLMLAAIAGMAAQQPTPRSTAEAPSRSTPAVARDQLTRCRTLTMPDAGCEAAWEAERRRFFRDEKR